MRIVVTAKRSAGLNTFLNFATIKEVFTNTGKNDVVNPGGIP